MNESPSSPELDNSQSTLPSPKVEPALGSPHDRQRSVALYIALAALAVLLVAQWWNSRAEIRSLRAEVASHLQAGSAANTETKVIVKSMQDGMRELQSKVSVLESKQVEAQSQQVALEQLYQEMSRNRDDWALSEIEQVLSTASQQLQLAGNVQGALIALQNADSRLSRFDKPQFIAIRRAIARDQDRLKALPVVDITGIVLRLDSVTAQIDGMPLLSDEKAVTSVTPPKTSQRLRTKPTSGAGKERKADEAAQNDWLTTLNNKWQSWSSEMWNEVRQLIRVRSVETPEALLLSPTQAYYVRENLKLRLMNARLALLSRNEPAFRNDLVAAQDAITRYFDTRAKQTQVVQALLKQVQASNLAIEMPTLADSLNAVRNFKAKP